MNILIEDQQQLIANRGYMPAVSLMMPFHPIMSSKKELEYQLKRAVERIESQLMEQYAGDRALLVLEKLHRIVRELNYNTHKKSVAILVSPQVEKVYYLDFPMDEKVVVDDAFDIRDLVYAKKQVVQYLVLLLSAEQSKIYLGNCSTFILIKSNGPSATYAYVNDAPERTANFSDPLARKEVLLDKFLYHMDQEISYILKAYPFPVFVVGVEKVLGHFRQITHHARNIVGYVPGNYLTASEASIRTAMQPYVKDWKQVTQADLINRIRAAADEKRLSTGIREIFKISSGRNGRLLVIEKGLSTSGHELDNVIEKVLAGGGDVEFVEDDSLEEFDGIALIRYY
jgi:hypothetical protein